MNDQKDAKGKYFQFCFVLLCVCGGEDRVLLCSPDFSRIYYVAQDGLKFTENSLFLPLECWGLN